SVSSLPRRTLSPGWNLVPRWRTMIAPARTFVPVVTFTPSRWDAESRPFREEDAPFFFDMGDLRLLRRPLRGRGLLRRRCFLLRGRRLRRRLSSARLLGGCLPRGAAGRDAGDLDHGVCLPVPPPLPVVRFRLVREARDLGPTGLGDDPGADPRRREVVRGGQHTVAVDDEDGRQLDLARIAEPLDLELLTLLDAVLLAAALDHRIHNRARLSDESLQQGLVYEEAGAVAPRTRPAERLDQALRDPLAGPLDQP